MDDRALVSLRHLPRRRPRSRQGGDHLYVLANDETLESAASCSPSSRRWCRVMAILLVGSAILIFNLTALQMTDATTALERTSAAAILGARAVARLGEDRPDRSCRRAGRRAAAVVASGRTWSITFDRRRSGGAADLSYGVSHMPVIADQGAVRLEGRRSARSRRSGSSHHQGADRSGLRLPLQKMPEPRQPR